MKYNKLEQEILIGLRGGAGLAYPAATYPFQSFYKSLEDVECSEDEFSHTIKILHVEGLLEANIDPRGNVVSIQDITGFGLAITREILQEQEQG